ncbi:MAG: extracellular solute-binding protein [Oscillospiraceae bacterium]|nr:extracellular solute-binding protein [Oscillospiraceae bacterium]
MKRTIALLLLVSMILIALAACGSQDGDTVNQGNLPNAGNDDIPGSDGFENGGNEEVKLLPDLPDGQNFGGHVFTFLVHEELSDDWLSNIPLEIVAEIEETEEPIVAEVYKRNEMLKEKYNVDFRMLPENEEHNVLRRVVQSGDDTYDAVVIFNNNIPPVINNGLLVTVDQLPYVDLDKPWWDDSVNGMSVANKQFLLGGDILILDNEATNALVFNKKLMSDLQMELPYNLVNEGKWTMDKLNDYVKGGSFDLNGNGVMDVEEDRWGFVCYRDTMHALLVSGGGALAVKDADDLPFIDFASDRNLSVLEKVMDIMYNKIDVLNIQSDISDGGNNSENWLRAYHNAFEQDRALFMWVRMRVVEKFRGMDSDFGIVPLPKFDENQANYHSVVNPYTGVLMGVPNTASNLDRTSIILEAMAAESRYTIQPAYYDVVLTRKFARDAESEGMLDIIFNSRVYDIGAIYAFGNVFIDLITLADRSNTDAMSFYERRKGQMERDINRLIESIQNMD